MNRYGKINWILIAALLVIILVLLVVLIINMDDRNTPNLPEEQPGTTESTLFSELDTLVIESIVEQGDVVVVTTNYCQVEYPYPFSDLVSVESVNAEDKTALQFFARINGVSYKVYELSFNGTGTLKMGTLNLTQGQLAVDVYATIYAPDPSLDDNGRLTFIAAQETFNDVAFSLYDNAHFTPAE